MLNCLVTDALNVFSQFEEIEVVAINRTGGFYVETLDSQLRLSEKIC